MSDDATIDGIHVRYPDVITSIRIVCSVAMLFVPELSVSFFVIYISAGFSDVFDGYVSRRFRCASEFGSVFDTFADLCFFIATLVVLFKYVDVPIWLFTWVVALFFMKESTLITGFVLFRKIVVKHTTLNRITGLMFFMLPFAIGFMDFTICAAIVTVVATMAVIQEMYLMISDYDRIVS